MAQSIEFKIRFKATIIYLIVALCVLTVVLYFNNLQKDISTQRLEMEHQQKLLSMTNDLMLAVSDAQSLASLYISTNNKNYLNDYAQSVDSTGALIDSIILLKPNAEEKLHRIEDLLREQFGNMKQLNLRFAERNPVELINERLKEYQPYSKTDTIYTTYNVRRDTIISEIPQKRFFRRFAEVFSPSKDSIQIVVNQWTDTIREVRVDTLAIMYEVEHVARMAREAYERNIKMIEQQVGALMTSNKDVATEASALLFDFYKETLFSILTILQNSEETIDQNYRYSTIAGILALGFILVFTVLISTDINKGRRARQALEEANERTRRIMESRHQLLLSVSHDIKTPLNSVLGYLSMMESDPNVRSMQYSSEHILSMLENLLGFSCIEQGTLQISLSDFNLKELFEGIYQMFLPLADQKSIELFCTADDVRIRTDAVKLKQIVINLVSNAIKYTKTGRVNFEAKLEENKLIIEVQDTGVGIPEAKISQIFLPFSRVEENNALAGGTGLGMFVVKGLIDLLDGTISIYSEAGEGTTVVVHISVAFARCKVPHGAKKIKVYDDDPIVVKMVSDMLLRLGHQVVDQDYDLIITDMEMGGITGVDILRQTEGAVPVVVMTGRADFSAHKAAELGFDTFLPKPFTLESLREVVGDGEPQDIFFGDNREEIMLLFRASVGEQFALLRQALTEQDFKTAQSICHKMFPMFAQMGYPTVELRNMDAHRSGPYAGWEEEVERILSITV